MKRRHRLQHVWSTRFDGKNSFSRGQVCQALEPYLAASRCVVCRCNLLVLCAEFSAKACRSLARLNEGRDGAVSLQAGRQHQVCCGIGFYLSTEPRHVPWLSTSALGPQHMLM